MIFPKYNSDGILIHNGDRYQAIQRLHKELDERGIPHDFHKLLDGYQICVPEKYARNRIEGDAVQHYGSYGTDADLIEVYGFGLKEPVGYLTVEGALEYFVSWWENSKEGENG